MTRFIIMINEVGWQPKNWINSLSFKIKKQLSPTWLTFRNNLYAFSVNLSLEQKDSYFKDFLVLYIYIYIYNFSYISYILIFTN